MLVIGNYSFSWGLTICEASSFRKHASKMSLEERHDFNLYMYHHKYWKKFDYGKSGSFNNAMILVRLKAL